MRYFLLLSFLFFVSFSVSFGQNRLSTSSKKAEKFFWKADAFRKQRNFDESIGLLRRALAADADFVEAHHLLGTLLIVYGKKEEAANHFKTAISLAPESARLLPVYPLVTELSLMKGDYEGVKEYGTKFLSLNPNTARYQKFIALTKQYVQTADYALEGMKTPVDFNPKPLSDEVNRFAQQYFPVLTADQQTLIFTARLNAQSDESMFESKWVEGEWTKPVYLEEINTAFNEGTCSISADGRLLIFTACDHINNPRRRPPGAWPVLGSCDLFMSQKIGGQWQKAQNLGKTINSRHWESQPSLSADGRVLYFVSNRPGGLGGKDIWMSTRNAENRWTTPVNLGKPVNSAGDDISPFIHANGQTLFFASDTHPGYGGLDLFRSERNGKTFSAPENLGYPINTHTDQVSLFITADGLKGYYSDEFQQPDQNTRSSKIQLFDIPETLKPKNTSGFVKGTIYDAHTKAKLSARIDLINLENEEVVSSVHSDQKLGTYLIVLTQGASYALYVNKKGYLFQSRSFDYTEAQMRDSLTLDIYLTPIVAGAKITLNNIFFASASYALLPKSRAELNKIVDFLSKNETVNIEIGGHTDNVGTEADNLVLSQARAQAVVNYLTDKGIAKTRVTAKGYGETSPILPNTSPENKARNRRTEFKIL